MPRSQSLITAQKKYYEKVKNNEEFKAQRAEATKRYYHKNKEDAEWSDRKKERSKEYYEANRERILSKKRENYMMKKNKDIEQNEDSSVYSEL